MKGDKKVQLLNKSETNYKLKTDYHRLKRIILNLLTNALKYTPEGTISITGSAENLYLNIVVQDSGAGMEKDALNKLFKEFSNNVEAQG